MRSKVTLALTQTLSSRRGRGIHSAWKLSCVVAEHYLMVFIRHGGTGEPRLAEKFVVKVRLCFHIFRMPQSIFGISIWVAQAIRRTKCEQRFELMGAVFSQSCFRHLRSARVLVTRRTIIGAAESARLRRNVAAHCSVNALPDSRHRLSARRFVCRSSSWCTKHRPICCKG